MTTKTIYRKDRELTGKELSANTLASILVAQAVNSAGDVSISRPMAREVMLFLNRAKAILYWSNSGWFRADGDKLFLTQSGLDEVQAREAGVSFQSNGKKKGGNVSPERVAAARRFILTGVSDETGPVVSRAFNLQTDHI